MDCLLDIQKRGPPSHIRYPEMERDLNKSKYVGASVDLGTLASCGPQFASVKVKTLLGSVGNFTNASRLILCLEVNCIPYDNVPLRYLIAYLAAEMCDGVALCRYLESILVIVERSGRVHVPNQVSDPT